MRSFLLCFALMSGVSLQAQSTTPSATRDADATRSTAINGNAVELLDALGLTAQFRQQMPKVVAKHLAAFSQSHPTCSSEALAEAEKQMNAAHLDEMMIQVFAQTFAETLSDAQMKRVSSALNAAKSHQANAGDAEVLKEFMAQLPGIAQRASAICGERGHKIGEEIGRGIFKDRPNWCPKPKAK